MLGEMGFSESDSSKCRRHPNPRQSPGVCSSCLREKLSKLSTTPSFSRNRTYLVSYSSSLSSTPPLSSTSSSTATVGNRKSTGNRHRRNGSETYVSVGMVLNSGLKKSRSVSCAPLSRNRGGNISFNNNEKNVVDGNTKNLGTEEEQEGNFSKKKGGFLKRLIHSTSKKTKGALMHSKTMNERSHVTLTTK